MKRSVRSVFGAGVSVASLVVGALHLPLAPWAPLAQGASEPSSAALTPYQIVTAGSSSVLYVLGTGACGGTFCLHLIRTTVSGRKDAEVPLPIVGDLQITGGYSLYSLSFANPDDGYALVSATANHVFYATRDGATNWHHFAALPGLQFERINVSSSAIYATMAKCKRFDDDCVNVTVARSPLWPIHWTALRTPKIPNNGLNGGIPLVSVDGSSVWLSQWANNGEVIWRSVNEGRTFLSYVEPNLVSINGCSLYPTSTSVLWGECPTGMLVSFYYSSDGGARWVNLPQRPYGGTGGGFFAPVSNSLAYLDYGQTPHNFYRVNMRDAIAVHVGEVACDNAYSVAFSGPSRGLVACLNNGTMTQESFLLSTNDGGVTWHKVSLSS